MNISTQLSCVLLIFLSLNSIAQSPPIQISTESIPQIDLSNWNQRQPISLEGLWYLDYQSLKGKQRFQGLETVPSLWRKLDHEPSLSGLGVGKYQIRLLLPTPQTMPLSFSLPWASAAQSVRFFYNDKWYTPLPESSSLAADNRYRHPLIPIPSSAQSLLIEISINSNFSTNGGIEQAPLIGPTDFLIRKSARYKIIVAAMCAIIMTLALGNLTLWAVRPKNTSFLLLSLLAVTISARIFVSDSDAVYDFFPAITIFENTIIGWLIFLVAPVLAALYFYINYRFIVGNALLIAVISSSAIAAGILVFTDIPTLQTYANVHRPLIVILTLYMVIRIISVYIKGKRSMLPSVISSSAVIFGFIVETVHFQIYGVVSPYLAFGLGWLAFLGVESFKVTQQFRQSLAKIDRLTDENETLNKMAHIDALTGLPNRRAFDDCCMSHYNDAMNCFTDAPEKDDAARFSVMFIDLDYFKRVNDQYGHDAGDAVLINVAKALTKTMRQNDFVARLGGEEFCLLLPSTSIERCKALAQRIGMVIQKTITHNEGKDIKITASIGISLFNGQPLLELIRQADQALYAAKDSGRNTTRCYWELDVIAS